ncbi:MAG: hypothetical protein LBC67_01210 [Spirochaetales bacterium]|jgi:hypothetical protein|nr:hypothetical protein [Spirochaetales bacterium]
MTNNWKFAAFLGAAAFCVSLLFGITGRAGFGVVVLRALGALAVFGGLGFAAALLFQRFLPELFQDSAEEKGRAVNITVPDMNPHEEEDRETEDGGGRSEIADIEDVGEDEPVIANFPALRGGRDEDMDELGELVEEVEELPPPVEALDDAPLPAPAEDIEDAGEGRSMAQAELPGGSGEVPEALPDMDDLDMPLQEMAPSAVEDDLSGTYVFSGVKARGEEEQDPLRMAKAVSSMLKKEKEG